MANIEWDADIQWDDEEPTERSYAGRVGKESLPALGNLLTDIPRAIGAGVIGAGASVAGFIEGQSPSESLLQGTRAFESSMESARDAHPRFRGPQVERAEQTFGELIEKGVGYIGDLAEEPVPFALGPSEANNPAARTIGEAATNFLPMPGASAFSRIPRIGSVARAADAAKRAEAEQILQRGIDAETEYKSWEDLSEQQRQYQLDLMKLDNEMIKYPKDLQSPQLGLGGRVARHEDQVGKRQGGVSQIEWDDEMMKHEAAYSKYNVAEAERERLSSVRFMQPWEPKERKPHIIREGDLADDAPFEIADEVRQRMQPRDNSPKTDTTPSHPEVWTGEDLATGEPMALTVRKLPDGSILVDDGVRLIDITKLAQHSGFEAAMEHYFPGAKRNLSDAKQKPRVRGPEGELQEDLPGPVGAVKDPGGNWNQASIDSLSEQLTSRLWRGTDPLPEAQRTRETMRSDLQEERVYNANLPMIQWVDKTVRNYLNRYAGTARDPLNNIEIPMGEGTARWETVMDQVVKSDRVEMFGTADVDPAIPDGAPVWHTSGHNIGEVGTGGTALHALRSYLDHVGDYLQQLNLTPEQLKRYDLVRAVRETAEWDKQMAKKMAKARVESQKNITVHKTYPDGFKWVQLDKPGQFAAESDQMGHSVRGYEPDGGHPEYGLGGWDAIKRGDAAIYSLRDPEGRSHVTIEVNRLHNTYDEQGLIQRDMTREGLPHITQIKGKQNRRPEQKYLSYVQDFVKSQKWGDIGDFENTGLINWRRELSRHMGAEGNLMRTDADKAAYDMHVREAAEFFGDEEIVTREQWEHFRKGGRNKDILKGTPSENAHLKTYNRGLDTLQTARSDAFLGQSKPTFRDQLKHIERTSTVPYYREVAKLLLADEKFNPNFALNKELTRTGMYYPTSYRIEIHPKWVGDESLTIHEGVHARTHSAIEVTLRRPEVYPHLVAPVKRLQELYLAARDLYERQNPRVHGRGPGIHYGKEDRPYGFTDIHEFIAEGFSNPFFQAILARTPLPQKLRRGGRLRNYWDSFVDNIGKVLGFDQKSQNFLSELMRTGADIMHGADEPVRSVYHRASAGREENWQPLPEGVGAYSIKDFKQELDTRGLKLSDKVVRAMYEKQMGSTMEPTLAHPKERIVAMTKDLPGLTKLQQQYVDSRPWEEALPEFQKSTDVSSFHANVTSKIIQGKFTATDHPLWSWVSSRVHWIKNNTISEANKVLHGKSRHAPDPGTYNYRWKQLTPDEREVLNQVGWEFNDAPTQVTKGEIQKFARTTLGKELTDKQLEAYFDRVRINKETLGKMNERLMAEKKQTIHELPNYWSPNVFDGPFIIKFIDPNRPKGEQTVKVTSSYLRPSSAKLAKLEQEFGHKIEIVERGLKGELDFDQLSWVLRHLNAEMRDPAARAIAEGLRRQGFMKHSLKRRLGKGGKGSGEGRQALREYEETSEKYIRGAYEWIANRELDKLYNQVLDEKTIDHVPNAKGFALEAIDQARGGANAAMESLSRVVSDIFRGTVQISTLGKLRLPQRALKDVIRQGNKIGTTLLLGFGHIWFIGAQVLQHSFAYPKMMAIAAEAGLNSAQMSAALFKAMAKSTNEFRQWDSSADIRKLQETGVLDPTFKYDWSTYASDSDPRFKATLADHLTGISTMSWVESNTVRRPASLLFLNMLRELNYKGKTPDEIYYLAKELTDHYMVSTKWHEKPHMFGRTGLAGTTLGPLQSFTTTWAGMFREYGKLSAKGLLEGSVVKQMPLVSFMSINLLTAGMMGLVGIKEWDVIANWINEHFGYNIPTGTEWVMSKFKDNRVRYGVLGESIGKMVPSVGEGIHIGATMSAPTLTGSFAVGGTYIYNMLNAAYTVSKKFLSETGVTNSPTSEQMRDALKGVSPRFGWGIPYANWGDIEHAYTPPGRPYQDMAGNAGPITRDNADWNARRLGTYTTKEAAEKARVFTADKDAQQRSQRLSKTMARAVDMLMMDPQKAMQNFGPMIQELKDDRFTGSDIKQALRRELMSKYLEADVKAVGKGQSSKQQWILQLYQQLGQ